MRSAELLAAVDFADAMSNPLHKNIHSLWVVLDSYFLSKTEFTHGSLETRFLPGYFAAKTKIYQEKPGRSASVLERVNSPFFININ